MKIKLTLEEIYALDAEISGATNPQTQEVLLKGLLNQELSLVTKFKVSELKDLVSPHKKNVDTLREELIKKLGEADPQTGNISLPVMIDKVDAKGKVQKDADGNTLKELNPNFREFNQEIEKLLQEERELEIPEFKIEDFDVKTDEKYDVFFKLLKQKTT